MVAEKVRTKKANKINYYWYSRCRYWDVSIIPQLAFNAPIVNAPKKGSELDRCFKAIRQGIESGHLTPRKGSTASPWSRGRALFSPALQGWMDADKQFYRTQLLAGQVFNWLVFTHRRNFKYAPEFIEMGAEIYPYDFANQVGTLPAWSIPNIIRIVFGERYKDWPEGQVESAITKFLELIKTTVSAGIHKPLHLLPSENINEWEFRPIEIIEFFASESFESWRFSNQVDVLQWVSNMFEQIEEDDLQQNQEKKKNTKEKNQNTIAPPAPTTKRARDKALQAKALNIFKKLKKKGKPFTYQDIFDHPNWPYALEDSGYSKDHKLPEKTLQNWLAKFRKLN